MKDRHVNRRLCDGSRVKGYDILLLQKVDKILQISQYHYDKKSQLRQLKRDEKKDTYKLMKPESSYHSSGFVTAKRASLAMALICAFVGSLVTMLAAAMTLEGL